MRELTVATSIHDWVNTFCLIVYNWRGDLIKIKASLHNNSSGGYHIISNNMVCDFSSKPFNGIERDRIDSITPIVNGDYVLVNGQEYVVSVNGDWQIAAELIKIRRVCCCTCN